MSDERTRTELTLFIEVTHGIDGYYGSIRFEGDDISSGIGPSTPFATEQDARRAMATRLLDILGGSVRLPEARAAQRTEPA